jgi:hypothetical protein
MEREEIRGQEAAKLSNLRKGRKIVAEGDEPMRQALYRISGVDLATIDAVGVGTIQIVMSEYGPDLSRFPTENTLCLILRWRPIRRSAEASRLIRRREEGPPVPGWPPRSGWRPFPCVPARPLSAHSTARPRDALAETSPSLPQPERWL